MHRPALWKKQEDAINFASARRNQGYGLLMEMGTGKSRVQIEIIQQWFDDGAKLGYIVAPLSGMYVWVTEWHLWSDTPVLFVDLTVHGKDGVKLAKSLVDQGYKVICILNYETAWNISTELRTVIRNGQETKKRFPVKDGLDSIAWDFGVLDEAQKIKTPSSVTSQFFRKRMKKVTARRCVLTGSAYTKSPLDVWAMADFVLADNPFSTYTTFKSVFSYPHPYIQGAIGGYQNLEKLAAIMAQWCVLLKQSEVLDLPPSLDITKYVTLNPATMKVYRKLQKEFVAEFEAEEHAGKTITTEHVFTRVARLRQLTSGLAVMDREWDEGQECYLPSESAIVDTSKVEALIDILEDRTEPTLIVVQFTFEEKLVADAIEKHFKVRPKILTGDSGSAEARHALVKSMAQDRFSIIKEEVGCRAMDMRFATTTIFFSHRFNTEAYEQMRARNHRGGQTRSITYVHLVAQKTIDEHILNRLNQDREQAEKLEGHWRDYLRVPTDD